MFKISHILPMHGETLGGWVVVSARIMKRRLQKDNVYKMVTFDTAGALRQQSKCHHIHQQVFPPARPPAATLIEQSQTIGDFYKTHH